MDADASVRFAHLQGGNAMARNPVSALKEENADLQLTLDTTYEEIEKLLDPALSREEIVKGLQGLADELEPDGNGGEEEGN
jgi:hypothetical protein